MFIIFGFTVLLLCVTNLSAIKYDDKIFFHFNDILRTKVTRKKILESRMNDIIWCSRFTTSRLRKNTSITTKQTAARAQPSIKRK